MKVSWLLGAAMVASLVQSSFGAGGEGPSQTAVSHWRESKCCGANSLYAVLKLHGLDVSLAETHALATPGEFGVSLAELEAASKSLGFPMTTVQVDDFGDLSRFQFPVIAHLGDSREGHFVVLLALDEAQSLVLMADALSCDIRWKSVSFLQHGWSGFLLVSERDLFFMRLETNAAVALAFGLVGLAVMTVRYLRTTATRTGRGA